MHIFAHTERANGSEKPFGLSGFTHSQTSFEGLDFCDLSNLRHLHLQLRMATLYSHDAIQKICCHVVVPPYFHVVYTHIIIGDLNA